MKGVTGTKGLHDLRTATTRHTRVAPPQRGTAHLDMYLLNKEKQRLDQELSHVEERRERIQRRIQAILERLDKLRKVASLDDSGGVRDVERGETGAIAGTPSNGNIHPNWKTITVEY